MNDTHKRLIKWSAGIAGGIVVFLEFFLYQGHFFRNISYGVTISVLLISIYTAYVWRLNPFEKTPRLERTYRGILRSSYNNIEKECHVYIHQTLLRIQISLITDESTSQSIASEIVEEHGEYYLYYIYRIEPKMSVRNNNPIRYGATKLNLKKNKIAGNYWSDNGYNGEFELQSGAKI